MARRILLSLLTAAAAGTAWWLRVQQLSSAYEPGTSLPLPPDRWGWALWLMLGALALFTLLLTLPEKNGRSLSEFRPVPLGTVLQGAGALLIAAGAAWQLCELYPSIRSLAALGSAAVLLGALGLVGGLKACLGGECKAGALLILPMCASGLQLLLIYREVSSDPILRHYEMRMLALGAAALAVIALCGLAFGAGGRRRFLLLSALTPALCAAALCTSTSFAQALQHVGCTLASFGFFLSVLFGIPLSRHPVYELVEDPFHTGPIRPRDGTEDSPTKENSQKPAAETPVSVPAAAPAPVQTPSPAESPVPEDDFDLARVDRLMRELEEDSTF